MNPSDASNLPNIQGMDGRDRSQNEAAATSDSALISYQPSQTPIDFTEFLNLEDNQLPLNESGSLDKQK